MEVKLNLCWGTYEKSICKGLGLLQQRGELVDMTIAADGHLVKAHQVVLSIVSPYIKELIASARDHHPILFLNQATYETLKLLMEYAYTGEVTVAQDKLTEFLQTGRALHIRGLEMDVHINSSVIIAEETAEIDPHESIRTYTKTKDADIHPQEPIRTYTQKKEAVIDPQEPIRTDTDMGEEEAENDPHEPIRTYTKTKEADIDPLELIRTDIDMGEEDAENDPHEPIRTYTKTKEAVIDPQDPIRSDIDMGEEEAENEAEPNESMENVRSAECSEHSAERAPSVLSNDESENTADESLDRSIGSEFSETSEEDTATDRANSTQIWNAEYTNPIQIPFTGNSGILLPNARQMSPVDYFNIFFNISFLSTLAEMTNAHAREILAKGFAPDSRLKWWKDVCGEEMKTFLGVLFFMGSVRLNRINEYWAKNYLVKFNLSQYMSRNKFLLMLRMLYFQFTNDSNNICDKVDDLINYFNETMKNSVYPQKELSIDESMVLFKGRLLIRQYNKSKFGIKLYMLADPSGLVHRIMIYKGSTDTEGRGQSHVKKVVLKLLQDYLGAGHSLFMDSNYNSVDLAEHLLVNKTYCTGALLTNRKGNPRVVTSKILTKGSNIYRVNNKGVCVMKWKDKRDVLAISTAHTPELKNTLSRRGRVVSKPDIVIQYNKYRKGVDRHDQMLSYYPCEHKAIKWYKKVGIHIFQMMLLNSFLMHKKFSGNSLTQEKFREQIINDLLAPTNSLQQMRSSEIPMHMPSELARNSNGIIKRRKCFRCWNLRKKRKDSGMFCSDCNLGFCINCYGPHHVDNSL